MSQHPCLLTSWTIQKFRLGPHTQMWMLILDIIQFSDGVGVIHLLSVDFLVMGEESVVHSVPFVLRIFISNFEGYLAHFSMDFNNSTWVGCAKREATNYLWPPSWFLDSPKIQRALRCYSNAHQPGYPIFLCSRIHISFWKRWITGAKLKYPFWGGGGEYNFIGFSF